MSTSRTARPCGAFLAAAAIALSVFAPSASAKNGMSLGKGIKCSWVLVSSVGVVNTYKQVCRKGV